MKANERTSHSLISDNSLKAKGRIGLDSRRAGKVFIPSPLTLMEKLEVFYLAPYYLQAFFFIIGTMSWLISETIFQVKLPFWTELWGWSLVLTNLFSLPLMNAVGMFLEEAEEKDYIGILSFMLLCYILVPFQAYAAVKGLLKKDEGPWFRTPKTGKVTDVFTRGQFYRWISGIIPGKRPSFAANMSGLKGTPGVEIALTDHPRGGATTKAFLPGGGILGRLGGLGKLGRLFGLVPKAWHALELRPAQVRLLAKLSLVILLVTSIGLSWLTPTVPLVHAAPDTFYFHDFGADHLASTPTDGKYWMDSTAADTDNPVKSFTLDSSGDTYYTLTDNMNKRWQRYEGGDDTWEETGNLNVNRQGHIATLLASGEVLVSGGRGLSYLSSSEYYNGSAWFVTGSVLGDEIYGWRENHTATLLNNGQVLAVGGEYYITATPYYLSSSQLYDRSAVAWFETSNLLGNSTYGERTKHTATLLNDGRVLVSGGINSASLSSTQLYDPSTSTWSETDDLLGGGVYGSRYNHTATLLNNGKVLVSGGINSASLSSTQLYDPSTSTWSETDDLLGGGVYGSRYNHTATLLNNGKVLVVGGFNGSSDLSSSELYDPSTESWTETGSLIGAGTHGRRSGHAATLMNNGQVLVSGGGNTTNSYLSSAQLYDPSTGTWAETDNLIGGSIYGERSGHAATLLNNGQVLISGGSGDNYLSSSQIFSPSRQNDLKVSPNSPPNAEQRNPDVAVDSTGNTFVVWEDNRNSLDQNTWDESGNLNLNYNSHTAALLNNGQVLVAGSYLDGSRSSSEIYDPSTGVWSLAGNLNLAHYDHTATLLNNGQVLVAGGGVAGSRSSSELYDPSTGVWSLAGNLNLAHYDHTATLLNNGQVLVAGSAGLGTQSSSELYDPLTGTWTMADDLNLKHYDHTATLLNNGQVLVAGSTGLGTQSSSELYDPLTGTWTMADDLNLKHYDHTATLLNNGQVLVAGSNASGYESSSELYDPSTGTWSLTGNLNLQHEDHTAALLNNGQVLVAGSAVLNAQSSSELYDPLTGTWTMADDLSNQYLNNTATLLNNGQVLLAGSGKPGFGSSSELFTPQTYDIYMQKFNTSGTPAWIEDKRVNSDDGNRGTSSPNHPANYDHLSPSISIDSSNNMVVAWQESRNSVFGDDIYAQKYDSSMNKIWPDTGVGTKNTWANTGDLITRRSNSLRVLLNNGKVLAPGGYDGSTYFSSAEIYDPATGTWALTDNMLNRHNQDYTLNLLNNGKALLAGGNYVTTNPSSFSELYDPATNTWTLSGHMSTSRKQHASVLLGNGKVMVMGGKENVNDEVDTVELYDPSTGTWSLGTSMSTDRSNHEAVVLKGGKVLTCGGNAISGDYLSACEIYDPVGDTWSATGNLERDHYGHEMILLNSGKVLLAGGSYNDAGAKTLSACELYDPGAGTWTYVDNLTYPIGYPHQMALMDNGKVLHVGTVYAEIFDPSTNTWTVNGELSGGAWSTGPLVLLNNGKVLSSDSSSELFTPEGDVQVSNDGSATNRSGVPRPEHPNNGPGLVGEQRNPVVTVDSNNDFIFAWEDDRYGVVQDWGLGSNVYENNLGASGACNGGGATNNSCGAIQSILSRPVRIMGQKINAAGTKQWGADQAAYNQNNPQDLILSATGDTNTNPAIATSGTELFVAWETNGGQPIMGSRRSNIYSQKFDSSGSPLWGGEWEKARNLNLKRSYHIATLMNDGQVLVTGGRGPSVLSSSEIFNNSTNTWAETNNMNERRTYSGAILLNSGEILTVGGNDNDDTLSTSELYDPSTGTWAYTTGSLSSDKSDFTLTLLNSGEVLLVGGRNWDGAYTTLSTTELYDPVAKTWALTNNLSQIRYSHTATLLNNGKVLVTGGYTGSNNVSSCEIYDPSTSLWTATGNMGTKRDDHTATLLNDGRVLVAAGHDSTTLSYSTAELYDPLTEAWTFTGTMSEGREEHISLLLNNGQVLVAGGYDDGTDESLNSAEIYDSGSGTWRVTNSLGEIRDQFTAVLLSNGQVLVAGGYNDVASFDLSSSEIFSLDQPVNMEGNSGDQRYPDIDTDSEGNAMVVWQSMHGSSGGDGSSGWDIHSQKIFADSGATRFPDESQAAWQNLDDLVVNRRQHQSVFLDNGQVLAAGGTDATTARSSSELYDSSLTWAETNNLVMDRYNFRATKMGDGQVLATGGYDGTDRLSHSELFDGVDTWTASENMVYGREEHSSTLMDNRNILVAGGYDGTNVLSHSELWDPGNSTWTLARNMVLERYQHAAVSLTSSEILVAGGYDGADTMSHSELYDPDADTWTATNNMSTGRAHHTLELLDNGKVLAVGGHNRTGSINQKSNLKDQNDNEKIKIAEPSQPLNTLNEPLELDNRQQAVGSREEDDSPLETFKNTLKETLGEGETIESIEIDEEKGVAKVTKSQTAYAQDMAIKPIEEDLISSNIPVESSNEKTDDRVMKTETEDRSEIEDSLEFKVGGIEEGDNQVDELSSNDSLFNSLIQSVKAVISKLLSVFKIDSVQAGENEELKLEPADFNANQAPVFDLTLDKLSKEKELSTVEGLWQKVLNLFGNHQDLKLQEINPSELEIKVTNSQGEEVDLSYRLKEKENGNIEVVIDQNQDNLSPGAYQIEVINPQAQKTITQDFTWGVLAINVPKSIYLPGEQVDFLMTVLDDTGRTVCDGNVELRIKNVELGIEENFSTEDGTITRSDECGPKNVTYTPDYQAGFQLGNQVGLYQMTMKATTPAGTREMVDVFEVKNSVDFDISRFGPTRINPSSPYEVKLTVKANQNFKGEVVEKIPVDFKIISLSDDGRVGQEFSLGMVLDDSRGVDGQIVWSVDWQAGETYELSYQFDAPDISPYLYLLGPFQVRDFEEARQWQIASDSPRGYTEKSESWTVTTADTWEDMNLSGSPYNVPSNAVVEIAIGNDDGSDAWHAGVRANGSTLPRFFDLDEAEGGGRDYVVMHAQADASSIIEQYADDDSEVYFTLLGYWDYGTYVEKMENIVDEAADEWNKISGFLGGTGVSALCFDSINNKVYFGGAAGAFGVYDPETLTAIDQSDEISGFWGNTIASLTFDTTNEKVYLGGLGGEFAVYDPGTDTATDQTDEISSFWSTNDIRALTFDSTNDTIYLGGVSAKFAVYDPGTDTATDQSDEISSFWSSSYPIYALTFDSTNDTVYLAGQSGEFASYDPGTDTATDQSDEISGFWGGAYTYSLTFDSINDIVYLGAGSGNFASYDPGTDTATDQSGEISGFWSGTVRSLVFDPIYEKIYLGGGSPEFAVYDPDTDNATDLVSKISGYWDTGGVENITCDPATGKIYPSAEAGEFVTYDTADNHSITATTWSDVTLSGSPLSIPANAVVEAVMMHGETTDYEAGIRENGSSLARKEILRGVENSAEGGHDTMTMLATADSSSIVEMYLENISLVVPYIVGYWSTPPGEYSEKYVEINDPTSDKTWTDRDLSGGSYTVPPNAITEVLLLNGMSNVENMMGVHTNGSGLSTRYLDVQEAELGTSGRDAGRIHTTVDSGSILELYIEDASDTYEFQLIGYWEVYTTVSGKVYLDDETTEATDGAGGPCDGSTSVVNFKVNGSGSYTATCSISDGSYSKDIVIPDSVSGSTVTAYLSSTDKANTVYVSDDGDTDTDIDLYLETVIVRDDADGTVTIPDLWDYDSTPADDTNMLFNAVDDTIDTLSVETSKELHIWDSDTFTPGGNVTTDGTTGHLHCDGSFTGTTTEDHVIDGNVQIDSGATLTAPPTEDDGTISVGQDWDNDNSGTFTPGTGKVKLTAVSGTPDVYSGGGSFYDLEIDDTNNNITFTLEDALDVNGDLTITGGTLDTYDTEDNNVNIAGSLSNSDIFTTNDSTVEFDGTSGSHTISGNLTGTSAFYDLFFDGSGGAWSFGNNSAAVTRDFTITNGTVTAPGSGYTLTVSRNFTNSDTFTHNDGKVIFNDSGQTSNITFSGDTTFYDFESTTDSKTLQFEANDSFAMIIAAGGTFVIQPTSADCVSRITIKSETNGDDWDLDVDAAASETVNYTNIRDSDVSGGAEVMDATNSADQGGNNGWNSIAAGACGITTQGNIYTDDGVSTLNCIAEGAKTVDVRVNGIGAMTAECTQADGQWSTTVAASADDVITAYLDEETEEATHVLVSDGTNQTNIHLYQNRVILRDDAGSNITNDLVYDGTNADSDDDIKVTVDAETNGNMTIDDGFELHVWTGDTFAPGTGTVTTSPAADSTTPDGDIHIDTSAVLTLSGGVSCGGDWTNAGTFTHGSQTVTFTGTDSDPDFAIDDGGSDWSSVTFNGTSGEFAFANSTIIAADLTMTNGTLNGTNDITVNGGDVTGDGDINLTSGTFTVDGASGTGFGGDTAWDFYDLTFGGVGGAETITAIGTGGVTIANDLNIIEADQTLNAGSKVWTLSKTSNPFSVTGVFTASTSTFKYTGNGSYTITDQDYYNLYLHPAGTVTYTLPSGTLLINNDLEVGDGSNAGIITADTNDTTVDVNGSMTINASGTYTADDTNNLTIAGNFTKNGTFTHSNGKVVIDGDAGSTSTLLYGTSTTFYDFTSTTATKTIKFDNSYRTIVSDNLTINGGSCANAISIDNDDGGATQFEIEFDVAKDDLEYIKVKNSHSINAVSVTNSEDQGNNHANWTITDGACVWTVYHASCDLYDPDTGTWAATGTLNTARAYHATVKLTNGKIAAIGGLDTTTYLSSVEVYDPATATWTSVGNLNTARSYTTAHLVAKNRIIIAGGYDGTNYLSSSEIFELSDNWVETGDLVGGSDYGDRSYHTATLLNSGKILVVGGQSSSYYSSSQLYDPSSGEWTNAGNLVGDTAFGRRRQHTATLLNNGQVLVSGGDYGTDYLSSSQFYDPSTGTWSETGNLNQERNTHTAVLLNNGKVLVVGGYDGSNFLSSAEIYNPGTGEWTNTNNLLGGTSYGKRGGHTATLLNNGEVLVSGGAVGSVPRVSSCQLYNPSTGTWTETGNLIGGTAYGERSDHTATLLNNGQVLISGGRTAANYYSSSQLYNPSTGTWTETGNLIGGTVYGERSDHTATLLNNGQVLISGGIDGSNDLSSSELFIPDGERPVSVDHSNQGAQEHAQIAVTDENKGVVVWQDDLNNSAPSYFGDSNGDWNNNNRILMQQIESDNGVQQWPESSKPLDIRVDSKTSYTGDWTTDLHTRAVPAIAHWKDVDDNRHAQIVWQDDRNSQIGSPHDIYGAKYDTNPYSIADQNWSVYLKV
ncbi:kelch repeat-containing protein [Patescibacteria group bacterium]